MRADGRGAQMGVISSSRAGTGLFFGASSPARLQDLLQKVFRSSHGDRALLEGDGLTNAIADGSALGLIDVSAQRVTLRQSWHSETDLIEDAKRAVIRQSTVQLALESLRSANGDRTTASVMLAEGLGANWKAASAMRNLGGLVRYATWANGGS